MIATAALTFALAGAMPAGGVTDGGDALYGAAMIGGPHCLSPSRENARETGCGVIYRIDYDGSGYRILHAFDGQDGRNPEGPLQLGPDGRLYGRARIAPESPGGVLFSLDRDGSGFAVLYESPNLASDTPFAVTTNGDVYAALSRPDGATSLAQIRHSAATVIKTVTNDQWFEDLRSQGNVVYALIAYRVACAQQIHRFDAAGHDETIFAYAKPAGTPSCEGPFLTQILPLPDGDVLGISNEGLERIHDGSRKLVYRVAQSFPGVYAPDRLGTPTHLGSTLDGHVVVSVSPAAELNCGSVLLFDRSGSLQNETIFPADRDVARITGCYSRAPYMTVDARGFVYGTTGEIGCEGATGGAGASPLTCGSVFADANGAARTLHAFGAALWNEPAAMPEPRSFVDSLETDVDPHALLLTRTAGMSNLPFAAATPSPLPLALKSVSSGKTYPLTLQSRTTAISTFRPLGPPIPALRYVLPSVPPGMYDAGVPAAGYWSTRLYIPSVLHVAGAPRDGMQFLALAGLGDPGIADLSAPPALTDASGRTLGTAPLTLVSHQDGRLRFRVGNSREVVQFDGAFATAAAIPGVTATVEDPVQATMHAKYAGKVVYVRDLSATCVEEFGDYTRMGFSDGRLRIRDVYRLVTAAPLSIDGTGGEYAAFTALDPLVIVFDPPFRASVESAGGIGTLVTSDPHACVALYALAGDPWHLQRMFAVQPRVNPAWPAAFRRAVESHDVVPGMTREMVAASIGYPPVYATAADFKKLDDWKYDTPAPTGHEVFFKNGRVIRYDPPGQLP